MSKFSNMIRAAIVAGSLLGVAFGAAGTAVADNYTPYTCYDYSTQTFYTCV